MPNSQMPKSSKTVFVCQECGAQSPKWMGRCADCGAWNSLVEERAQEAVTAAATTAPCHSLAVEHGASLRPGGRERRAALRGHLDRTAPADVHADRRARSRTRRRHRSRIARA